MIVSAFKTYGEVKVPLLTKICDDFDVVQVFIEALRTEATEIIVTRGEKND